MRSALLLLALAGCAGPAALDGLVSAAPEAPLTEAERVVAAALAYGFEAPGDVPDRRLLPSRTLVPLCQTVDCRADGPALTARALPATRARFAFVTRAEIEASAAASGEAVAYALAGPPEVVGDSAEVFVGVRSLRVGPRGVTQGGAGYLLGLARERGGWRVLGVRLWIAG